MRNLFVDLHKSLCILLNQHATKITCNGVRIATSTDVAMLNDRDVLIVTVARPLLMPASRSQALVQVRPSSGVSSASSSNTPAESSPALGLNAYPFVASSASSPAPARSSRKRVASDSDQTQSNDHPMQHDDTCVDEQSTAAVIQPPPKRVKTEKLAPVEYPMKE
jgi:hypothetical protein